MKDVAISADGKIATLAQGDVVQVYKCEVCGSTQDVYARAVARAPRALSDAERREYLAAAD